MRDLFMALLGYVLAVFVAALFCLLAIFAGDLFFSPIKAPANYFRDFGAIYASSLVITGITAWPGFIATVAASWWRGYRSKVYFVLCGAATAVVAVLLFAAAGRGFGFAINFLTKSPAVYIGGLAGGFAYALYAHRFGVLERRAFNATE